MKPVIYQLVIRYFGNTNLTNQTDGTIQTNGCGKFADINATALTELKKLGATHVWLTGVLRQATLTDYSSIGLPADHPDIVKGIAGSFYAIKDYYDVCPDYANDPQNRLQEFEDLIQRIHTAGLQAIIDLVPNHVARSYESTINPGTSLGRGDDITQFFANQNAFFYLVTQANQPLRLSRPPYWNPPGVVFDGRFPLEDGTPGHPPKATGNNSTSATLSQYDWYETIKLNYGFNFVTQETAYSPRPRTWDAINDILAYWQAKGIDGFRCDFAHFVPNEAWQFLISEARKRRPAFFFAEAYPSQYSTDPVHSLESMIDAGFDAVYHYQAYNALKRIYAGASQSEYDGQMVGQSTKMRAHLITYLENHDERRVASPIVPDQGNPGGSGFGSAEAGYQLAPLHLLYGNGPAMFFNGQEVGEPGAGVAGFSLENGRTSIFDYWAMPEFVKWINCHLYDGGGLSSSQQALRKFYGDLLQLCQDPSVQADGYWGLKYFNNPGNFGDCPDALYSFARYAAGSGRALLIVANFSPGGQTQGNIRLPNELISAIGITQPVSVKHILNRQGSVAVDIATLSPGALAASGFPVSIPNQTSHVYLIE